MNDTIRLVNEAGKKAKAMQDPVGAAVLAEREACAKIAETYQFKDCQMDDGVASDIAALIRARKEGR